MDRHRFEHLHAEVCVACKHVVPRYPLWLALHEAGADPEALDLQSVLGFLDDGLDRYLASSGLSLSRWRLRKLRRAVRLYDPELTTPEELLARIDGRDERV